MRSQASPTLGFWWMVNPLQAPLMLNANIILQKQKHENSTKMLATGSLLENSLH